MNSKKEYPIVTLIAAGLYPLLYYYDQNYALINSKTQLLFFVCVYIILPITSYYVFSFLFANIKFLKSSKSYLLPVLNLACFFTLIVITSYGFDTIKMIIALVLGFILGLFLVKHLKKVVVFQLVLIGLVFPKLIPDVYRDVMYSKEWMQQPDAIEDVVFKKRPNVYIIQPDGYTNFSELTNDIYRFDNSKFQNFLTQKGFTFYDDFRSNYSSTLSSNSSMFGMKHHFYGNRTLGINPSHNSRNEIVGGNPALDIFKRNNYKSFLMLQIPYILANRPKIDFDYCNLSFDEMSYISRGFQINKPLIEDTKRAVLEHKKSSNFFFIESMLPSHIINNDGYSNNSIELEREHYLERLTSANVWLTQLINFITKQDKNALIIIAADHGGYVGLKSMKENQVKQTDKAIVNSMFSSALAIKWPENEVPDYTNELKSSVNLFRVLFSYLGENESFLNHLQDDSSYLIIREGAPLGVYQSLDEKGELIFNKLD
ncbi:hypothetical protein [Psychroserpens ponticola]|uniref:Sulfatase N-terminal domain-containing protein n=1 Tax=Psychroserpens ponticola TaxID=2932268 RepID=A0ABY7RX86_9FLAO|nr:hypothetical protein [Psychroserpens ponticola]WCO00841.1 hypothetical protein MUN68_012280 [Psychroserpens ponticola]